MFAKLIDEPTLPSADQRQILKDIIHTNVKNNVPEVRLQLSHNYAQLKPILLKHWKQAFRIVLSLFNWQTARDFLGGAREGNVCFDLLISLCSTDNDASGKGVYIMCELSKTYKQYWKALTILQVAGEAICERLTNPEDYNWFLARFVSISANVIQNYLAIKGEAKSGEGDRTESDTVLVNNCEQWVTQSYLSVFSKLKAPNNLLVKSSLLSAFSQILGALYESEREGHLSAERLHEIMDGAGRYVLQNYTVEEVTNIFLKRLRDLKYNSPPKKIQIPEKYSEQTEINTEGVCWIIHRFVEEGREVLSPQKELELCLLAYSELLPFPLKLKNTLFNRIKALFQEKVETGPLFEVSYPLGLLIFHVHHYDRLAYHTIAAGLRVSNNEAKINRLRRLLTISIDNLNVEKLTFVLQQLDEQSLGKKEGLLLLKSVSFDFTSAELTKEVLRVADSLLQKHAKFGKSVVSWVVEKERTAEHNLELCSQLLARLQ